MLKTMKNSKLLVPKVPKNYTVNFSNVDVNKRVFTWENKPPTESGQR